jgi:class 3 adenylate cyclase
MLQVMTWSVCGELIPEGARFCPNCGAVIATPLGTEERKIVTILFADLVDSTGLAERLDPERAREVLGAFFDAATEELQALRGRPEKFIGDAVMAVFGLPTVHEDDALRAVRAGLAIRGRLRRLGSALGLAEPLRVRVGIESGVAATGVGPAGQLLVTGPVVNAAARLQTAAGPGEVLAGETTHTLTESEVAFGVLRNIRAKGFTLDLPAYLVEGITTRSARRTIPLVGRSSELTILRDCLAHATATGTPALVTIAGEAGIGKSRLAAEALALARRRGFVTLEGAAYPLQADLAYAPVLEVLGPFLARLEPGRLAALVGGLPDLGRLFAGLHLPPPEPLGDAALERTRMFEAVSRLVERVGTKRVVTTGLLVIAGSLFALSFISADSSYLRVILNMCLMSVGMGLTMAPATESVMGSLPREKAGVGSAVNDTTRQVGGALGVAAIGSIVASVYAASVDKAASAAGVTGAAAPNRTPAPSSPPPGRDVTILRPRSGCRRSSARHPRCPPRSSASGAAARARRPAPAP